MEESVPDDMSLFELATENAELRLQLAEAQEQCVKMAMDPEIEDLRVRLAEVEREWDAWREMMLSDLPGPSRNRPDHPAAALQGTWLLTTRSLRQRTEETMTDTDPAKPGDEATPGAPGTGENLCRHCGGTGKVE